MSGWVCPKCSRLFARDRQTHECSPPMALDEYFSSGPEREQPIFEAVLAHLETLGPMHVEPVSVGIFIKSTGSFVQLRPKVRWVALSFPLPRREAHPRIARRPVKSGPRTHHIVNLTSAAEVDNQVCDWLTEAFEAFG